MTDLTYTLDACGCCISAAFNNDTSGHDHYCADDPAPLSTLPDRHFFVDVEDDTFFSSRPCESCGAIAGDRQTVTVEDRTPVLGDVDVKHGVAGQIIATVPVTYGVEPTRFIGFSGNAYGGPVIMVTGWGQTIVTDPDRHGVFHEDPAAWVRSFFS